MAKAYANKVVGSSLVDVKCFEITNLWEPTARSDVVTKGYVDGALDSIFNANLYLRGHKITNVANPVDAQDAIMRAFAEANYLKRGG